MKTYKQWENSHMPLHEFLEINDEIDEELYDEYKKYVHPYFYNQGWIQCGEPFKEINGVIYRETLWKNLFNNKCFYYGILPEFKL